MFGLGKSFSPCPRLRGLRVGLAGPEFLPMPAVARAQGGVWPGQSFSPCPRLRGPPQTPTSSRLLSQPPQARFERLSQVGRCRGLQGWEVLERYQARDWPGSPARNADLGSDPCRPPSENKNPVFFFVGKKSMGRARASRPVPGLVPLKYFPPLEAATAADLA